MAYVRERGRQLAIVEGRRDPETGKVRQDVLFTIYSRSEALEILGQGGKGGARQFENLMKHRFPGLRLDWKKIRAAIGKSLEVLPETYEYKAVRLHASFRSDLCGFLRQIAQADPQSLYPAAQLIAGHRHELEFLGELIRWRLKTCDQEENEWNRDDPFFWRFALAHDGVPPEVEEMASELCRKGKDEAARAVFRLLLESFGEYPEGHEHLGEIAFDSGELEEAAREFERTIELGGRKLPRRIARKDWWMIHETRVYIRGLMGLALTLNRAGKYEEALTFCARLDEECHDLIRARYGQGRVFLNTGRWREALDAGDYLHNIYPEENLIAALAAFELGLAEEATWRFLHAALTHPRAVRMMLDLKTPGLRTTDYEDVSDHNAGVGMLRDLDAFRSRQRPASRRFFRDLLARPEVVRLLEERAAVIRRWQGPHEPEAEWRAAFDRMSVTGKPEFARDCAKELLRGTDGSGNNAAAVPVGSRRPRGQKPERTRRPPPG
jgi:tetratricopeptide (TPR) repeat protein